MKRREGFTLVEIMIVVAIIGLLAGIAIPAFSVARRKSLDRARELNVRQLNHAVQQWAMESLYTDDMQIDESLFNYINGGLEGLSVGGNPVPITNITSMSIGHKFTVSDLY